MEHPFFATTNTRAEALRWLTIAEKLLSARDLMGSKSFATRARDSDPTLAQPDQILAVADTLLAGDIRIGNNQHDWYSILRLTPPQGRDAEFVATQYRNLALLLNPQQNKFSYADQAFRLVVEAWSVLSNPSRKIIYDKELAFFMQQQQHQNQSDPFSNSIPTMPQNMFFGGNPASSSLLQPQVHVGTSNGSEQSHFPQVQQVQAQPQMELFGSGTLREPQNYMNFTSGSNSVFGSSSRSDSIFVHANKSQETVSAFSGGVPYSSGTNLEQVNLNKQKAPQNNYTPASDKTDHNSNMNENVHQRREDEDLERTDVQEEERVDDPVNEHGESTIWTACPYCYCMYEYPSMYADCSLRCQKCKRAFQAVVIPSPPPTVGGQDYFYCWGFMPLGFSMENWEKNKDATPAWTPFSPMFTCPQMGNMESVNKRGGGRKNTGPRVYVDDDEVFLELSESGDSDDDDSQKRREKNNKRKAQNVKGKGYSGAPNKSRKNAQVDKVQNVSVQDGLAPADEGETRNNTTVEKGPTPSKANGIPSKKYLIPNKATGEPCKKGAMASVRKQSGRSAKNFGKLDLNIECSNEPEEPGIRMNLRNGMGRREDENIEGVGFFEGLDEFLSNLPILNVVGDDKAVKAA